MAVKLAKAKRVQGLVTEAATASAIEMYPTFKSYAAGVDAVTEIVKAEFDKVSILLCLSLCTVDCFGNSYWFLSAALSLFL